MSHDSDPGEMLERLWRDTCADVADFRERIRAHLDTEQPLRRSADQGAPRGADDRIPRDSIFYTHHPGAYDALGLDLARVAHNILEAMRRVHVPAWFAPRERLIIESREIDQALRATGQLHPRSAEFRPEDFSPARVWDAFVARYGDGGARPVVYQQSADELVRLLSLQPEEALPRKRGRVVLRLAVYPDSLAQGELTAHSAEDVAEVIRGLARAATESGCVNAGRLRDGDRDTAGTWEQAPVVDGERLKIGPLTLVTYRRLFEFRLNEQLATALQRFLATHATASTRAGQADLSDA